MVQPNRNISGASANGPLLLPGETRYEQQEGWHDISMTEADLYALFEENDEADQDELELELFGDISAEQPIDDATGSTEGDEDVGLFGDISTEPIDDAKEPTVAGRPTPHPLTCEPMPTSQPNVVATSQFGFGAVTKDAHTQEIEGELESLRVRFHELQNQYEGTSQHRDALARKVEQLEEELRKEKTERASAQDEVVRLTEKCRQYRDGAVKEWENNKREYQKQSRAEVDKYRQRVVELMSLKNAMSAQIERLQVTELAKERNRLLDDIKNRDAQIQNLAGQVIALKTEKSSLVVQRPRPRGNLSFSRRQPRVSPPIEGQSQSGTPTDEITPPPLAQLAISSPVNQSPAPTQLEHQRHESADDDDLVYVGTINVTQPPCSPQSSQLSRKRRAYPSPESPRERRWSPGDTRVNSAEGSTGNGNGPTEANATAASNEVMLIGESQPTGQVAAVQSSEQQMYPWSQTPNVAGSGSEVNIPQHGTQANSAFPNHLPTAYSGNLPNLQEHHAMQPIDGRATVPQMRQANVQGAYVPLVGVPYAAHTVQTSSYAGSHSPAPLPPSNIPSMAHPYAYTRPFPHINPAKHPNLPHFMQHGSGHPNVHCPHPTHPGIYLPGQVSSATDGQYAQTQLSRTATPPIVVPQPAYKAGVRWAPPNVSAPNGTS